MLCALMLSTAVLGIPTGVPASAVARQDDPAIRLWLDNDGRYQRGDRAKVQVKAREEGYLLVLNIDPDGRLRVLFPLDPGDDALIRGGRKYEIIGRGGREALTIEQRSGHGTVYAAISREPFRFDGYVADEHWDYAALDAVRISDEPESDLNQLVQKMARTDFDYDILGYDVYENVVYAGPATAYDYGPAFYPSYGGWGWGGTSLFIGLGFGHHRFFGNPFFFDPFFFDPFFFHPGFFHPFRPFHPFFGFPVKRPPFGRFFATPWRQRSGGSTFTGGFQWRGREVARTPTAAVLASAYRGRLNSGDPAALVPMPRPTRERGVTGARGTPIGGRQLTDATPTRRRSVDMTPGRTEQARPKGVGLRREPDRTPVGRRAVERPGSSAPLPQRVDPRADNGRGNRAEAAERPGNVRARVPEARPARLQIRDRSERNGVSVMRGDDRGGDRGVRSMTRGAPAARRAMYDRPVSRSGIERGRMESPGGRMRSGPSRGASMERIEPRGSPAPLARPEPRRARGGSDGWGARGGPAPRGESWGGWGGGGTWGGSRGGRAAWGGAWGARGGGQGGGWGVRGGGGGRGGGMGVGSRHR